LDHDSISINRYCMAAERDDRDEELPERRRRQRQSISAAIDFVPLFPSGPRFDLAIPGETRNVSPDGIAIVISKPPLLPRWAVRLNLGERSVMLEVSVRYIAKTATGHYFLACQFLRRINDGAALGAAPIQRPSVEEASR
jgi:hypothetical protein